MITCMKVAPSYANACNICSVVCLSPNVHALAHGQTCRYRVPSTASLASDRSRSIADSGRCASALPPTTPVLVSRCKPPPPAAFVFQPALPNEMSAKGADALTSGDTNANRRCILPPAAETFATLFISLACPPHPPSAPPPPTAFPRVLYSEAKGGRVPALRSLLLRRSGPMCPVISRGSLPSKFMSMTSFAASTDVLRRATKPNPKPALA